MLHLNVRLAARRRIVLTACRLGGDSLRKLGASLLAVESLENTKAALGEPRLNRDRHGGIGIRDEESRGVLGPA